MRKQHNAETERLILGLSAMRLHPEMADEYAEAYGITEMLAELRKKSAEPQLSYVYMVGTAIGDDSYYKIGKSVVPHMRLTALRSGKGAKMPPQWEGQPLQPVALRLGGLAVESTIHRDLVSYRLRGTEWFAANLAITQYVDDQKVWQCWNGTQPDPASFPSGTAQPT